MKLHRAAANVGEITKKDMHHRSFYVLRCLVAWLAWFGPAQTYEAAAMKNLFRPAPPDKSRQPILKYIHPSDRSLSRGM
jgi:hypothetical protein